MGVGLLAINEHDKNQSDAFCADNTSSEDQLRITSMGKIPVAKGSFLGIEYTQYCKRK